MGQIDYTWKDLTQMIPVNHRYRSGRQRMQPMLGALELEDGPMLWMMVLQICDGLSEAKLLSQLPENFCMRWFCGYGLAERNHPCSRLCCIQAQHRCVPAGQAGKGCLSARNDG